MLFQMIVIWWPPPTIHLTPFLYGINLKVMALGYLFLAVFMFLCQLTGIWHSMSYLQDVTK